ncbi:hypothetical protein CIPAW_13G139700 [Carya illinoinensis]|uniref:Uncharacterized protein n=1 Tax=Carya illinoinensis TaxID=32201 RepID=A0A8T1NSJ7_CARIL|nr:hypothetical protein CIPAW_13G139700 [Carya illinoinensis]
MPISSLINPVNIKTWITEHLGIIRFSKLCSRRFGELEIIEGFIFNLFTKKPIIFLIFFSETVIHKGCRLNAA